MIAMDESKVVVSHNLLNHVVFMGYIENDPLEDVKVMEVKKLDVKHPKKYYTVTLKLQSIKYYGKAVSVVAIGLDSVARFVQAHCCRGQLVTIEGSLDNYMREGINSIVIFMERITIMTPIDDKTMEQLAVERLLGKSVPKFNKVKEGGK